MHPSFEDLFRSRGEMFHQRYADMLERGDPLSVMHEAFAGFARNGNIDRMVLLGRILGDMGDKAIPAYEWLLEHPPSDLDLVAVVSDPIEFSDMPAPDRERLISKFAKLT